MAGFQRQLVCIVLAVVVAETWSVITLTWYHVTERQAIREIEAVGGKFATQRLYIRSYIPAVVEPPLWLANAADLINRQLPRPQHIKPNEWPVFDPVAEIWIGEDSELKAESLRNLGALRYLRRVYVDSRQFSDEMLLSLGNAEHLRKLEIGSTGITNNGLSIVSNLSKLETIILWDTSVDDDGVNHLRGHPSLRQVYLSVTEISDDSLDVFETIPNLELLSIGETNVTASGYKKLQERLQHVDIDWGPNEPGSHEESEEHAEHDDPRNRENESAFRYLGKQWQLAA